MLRMTPTENHRAAADMTLERAPLEPLLALAPFLPVRMRIKLRNRLIRHVIGRCFKGVSDSRAAGLLGEALRTGTSDNPLVAEFVELILDVGGGPVSALTIYNTLLA